jgi:uncharacterized protein (DUF4415 family)
MSARSTNKSRTKPDPALRGRADVRRLQRLTDREILATSPAELANLPANFWEGATIVEPVAKQPISLRVDADVLDWFKAQGPRYQSRMNAVLRSYMAERQRGAKRKTS